jgi:hypothetical protein
MRTNQVARIGALLLAWTLAAATAAAQSEVPAGTRFFVELRDDLKAKKVKPGKRFNARTLEALRGSDGSVIEAGARLKGRVAHAENNRMILRFEEIDTRRGWVPIVATVEGVVGERTVKRRAGREGEIEAASNRGRNAAIGAAVGAGVGAAVGASQGGSRGALIGAGAGAAGGALIGSATGGRDLELYKGARLELVLNRPLVFRPRR